MMQIKINIYKIVFLVYFVLVPLLYASGITDTLNEPQPCLDCEIDVSDPDGSLITPRNFPDIALNNYEIVPCRKFILNTINLGFIWNNDPNISLRENLTFDIDCLNDYDLKALCYMAQKTKEKKYIDIIIKIIKDKKQITDYELFNQMVNCLTIINNEESKMTLQSLLNNKDKKIATYSAIALAQIGDNENVLNFFNSNYSNSYYLVLVITTLIYINTPEAVILLEKIEKAQIDPAISLDAIAAQSYLGRCDYAFDRFKMLSKNKNPYIRQKAISCMAYYIGTNEAFNYIKNLKNDESGLVQDEIQKVLLNLEKQKTK